MVRKVYTQLKDFEIQNNELGIALPFSEDVAAPNVVAAFIKNGCMDKNKICICCSKCTEIMRTGVGHPDVL